MNWHDPQIKKLIHLALKEDAASSDVTTRTLIDPVWRVRADIRAKQRGVVAGLPLAGLIFKSINPRIRFTAVARDGQEVRPGTTLVRIDGAAAGVLSAERPALNALQHLSGIATFTHDQVQKLGKAKTKLLDTRKTLPGWRLLEKYAVRCGGGTNHRMSLGDAVLVKDNHLKICRLAGADWKKRLAALPRRHPGLLIQVEVQTENDLRDVLDLKPSMVLLDNLPLPTLKRTIRRLRQAIRGVQIEISGGVRPEDLRRLAGLGVERISMGRLTHSAPAFDCSLEITHVDPA